MARVYRAICAALFLVRSSDALQCLNCHQLCSDRLFSQNQYHLEKLKSDPAYVCCHGIFNKTRSTSTHRETRSNIQQDSKTTQNPNRKIPKISHHQIQTCSPEQNFCVTDFESTQQGYVIHRGCYSEMDKISKNLKYGFNQRLTEFEANSRPSESKQFFNVCLCQGEFCNSSKDPLGSDCGSVIKNSLLNYFEKWDVYNTLFSISLVLFILTIIYDEVKFKPKVKMYKKKYPGIFKG